MRFSFDRRATVVDHMVEGYLVKIQETNDRTLVRVQDECSIVTDRGEPRAILLHYPGTENLKVGEQPRPIVMIGEEMALSSKPIDNVDGQDMFAWVRLRQNEKVLSSPVVF